MVDRGDGTPMGDGQGNWSSRTTYAWRDRLVETRYVDSTSVGYVVVNPTVRRKAAGVVIGCRAHVTLDGKSIYAVVADVSGP